jgi:hypothetical protein
MTFREPLLILILVGTFGFMLLWTLTRAKRPPEQILRFEKPGFKTVFGWALVVYGSLRMLAYLFEPDDPIAAVFAIAFLIVGAFTVLSPSYSDLSPEEREASHKTSIRAIVILAPYLILGSVLVALNLTEVFVALQVVFVIGLMAWAVWRFKKLRRV